MAMTSPVRDHRRSAKPVANTAWPRLGRKGVFGAALAVASVAMLGMTALAAEGGKWYLVRRNAQSAADVAALAGAVTMAWQGTGATGQAAGVAASQAVSTSNGFTNASPTVVTPTPCIWNAGTCTPDSTAPNAMRVTISQPQSSILARLVSSLSPVVNVNAVAVLRKIGDACTLSRNNPTTFTGSNSLAVTDCVLASNYTPSGSIDCGGNANPITLSNSALYSVGPATRCDDLGANALLRGPPATDPYAALKSATWPTPSGNQCQQANQMRTGSGNQPRIWTPQPWTSGAPRFICADISIQNNDQLNLAPGLYFFYGSSLDVSGGTVGITGSGGVTLVFLAGNGNSAPGTVKITGGTTNLRAPLATESPDYLLPGNYPQLRGMLMYRQYVASDDVPGINLNNNQTIRFNGSPGSINLSGGMYFPTSQVFVAGVAGTGATLQDCTSIVASEITFTGNSTVAVNGCEENYGANVSKLTVVRLVQ